MSKIAIFCHGVPNLDSNQPNADTLMHAKKLSTLGHKIKIISITFNMFINVLYYMDQNGYENGNVTHHHGNGYVNALIRLHL